MKKLIALVYVFILLPVFAYSQIGAKTQQNKIQGTWVANISGVEMTLQLNADGSGTFDGKLSLTIISQAEPKPMRMSCK
jgi:hypothetical protein